MKRRMPLVLAAITFLLCFLLNWYRDHLFNTLFLFCFLLDIPVVVLFFAVFIYAVACLVKNGRNVMAWAAVGMLVFTAAVVLCFPFREAKTRLELALYEAERLEVIALIREDKLYCDSMGNVRMPEKYRMLSSDGNVVVYEKEEETVVSFWVFRGMLSGSVELIYSTGGEERIRQNESGHPIVSIAELKEGWYYVITDY